MTDKVTETPHTTVIERKSGGGGLLIGLALLIAVAIGGFYLFNKSQNDNLKTDAITTAADKVGDGAQKVGDSAEKATQ